MAYDANRLRARVSGLREGAAHFDGPGGTQVPDEVADAISETLRAAVSNRGRGTSAERRADDIVVGARQAMADLLGADPRGIVFGRSMTQITMDIARTLAQDWGPGDEVVVSRLDHDADVRPWVIHAERAGATAFLAKPFANGDVLAALETIAGSGVTEAAPARAAGR